MTLEICVIYSSVGLIYEWNGSQTVNVYRLVDYAHSCYGGERSPPPQPLRMWMMELEKPTAEDFIASVKEHIEGGT